MVVDKLRYRYSYRVARRFSNNLPNSGLQFSHHMFCTSAQHNLKKTTLYHPLPTDNSIFAITATIHESLHDVRVTNHRSL